MPLDQTRTDVTDYGVALLRVSLGVMYLAHGIVLKFAAFGLSGTAGYFTSIGLPGWRAYVTFTAKTIGGAMLALGIRARWVVLALTPALLCAIIWARSSGRMAPMAGCSPPRRRLGNIRSTSSCFHSHGLCPAAGALRSALRVRCADTSPQRSSS